MQSAVRCCVWHRLFCSTASELLSLASLQLFGLQFYSDVHKLHTYTPLHYRGIKSEEFWLFDTDEYDNGQYYQ